MFKTDIIRCATLHELEMLAAFHKNIRAIINASIVEFEVTFKRIFHSTLSIKVAIVLLIIIFIALPINLNDASLSCSFLLMRSYCIHKAVNRSYFSRILQSACVATYCFKTAGGYIKTFASTRCRTSAHISGSYSSCL